MNFFPAHHKASSSLKEYFLTKKSNYAHIATIKQHSKLTLSSYVFRYIN